jgi:hypothetical protein
MVMIDCRLTSSEQYFNIYSWRGKIYKQWIVWIEDCTGVAMYTDILIATKKGADEE